MRTFTAAVLVIVKGPVRRGKLESIFIVRLSSTKVKVDSSTCFHTNRSKTYNGRWKKKLPASFISGMTPLV